MIKTICRTIELAEVELKQNNFSAQRMYSQGILSDAMYDKIVKKNEEIHGRTIKNLKCLQIAIQKSVEEYL